LAITAIGDRPQPPVALERRIRDRERRDPTAEDDAAIRVVRDLAAVDADRSGETAADRLPGVAVEGRSADVQAVAVGRHPVAAIISERTPRHDGANGPAEVDRPGIPPDELVVR